MRELELLRFGGAFKLAAPAAIVANVGLACLLEDAAAAAAEEEAVVERRVERGVSHISHTRSEG